MTERLSQESIMTQLRPDLKSDTLYRFICETLLTGQEIGDTDELLISGLLDSLDVMTLVSFIEETYDISVPFSDVVIENFETVTAIRRYVQGRVVDV